MSKFGSKEDVLKALFPNGIPVDRLPDLDKIIRAADLAAKIAGHPERVEVPAPAPTPIKRMGAFNNPAIQRKAKETAIANAKVRKDQKVEALLTHILQPKVHFHPTTWLARHFQIGYRVVVAALTDAIAAKRIEVYDADGNVLTSVAQMRNKEWRARVPRAGLSAVATVEVAAEAPQSRAIDVEDTQVQKVLEFIQDSDKTIQDISKHFHYSPGYVEQVLKTAHTKFGFKFNRDAAGTLSIVFIPPKQLAAAV